jgi:hypothetical protein
MQDVRSMSRILQSGEYYEIDLQDQIEIDVQDQIAFE